MKSIEILSFILVYFAFTTFTNSKEILKATVKNETVVQAHSDENKYENQLVNSTHSTKEFPKELSTVITAPESEKLKTVKKVEVSLNNSETSITTNSSTTTTVSPVKLSLPANTTNSTSNPQKIFTEGGPTVVDSGAANANKNTTTILDTTSSSTSSSISTTTNATTTTKFTSSTTMAAKRTTITSTTTTTTTTTPKPKKPTIVFSDEDQIDNLPEDKKFVQKTSLPSNHEVEEPYVQSSKEKPFNPHRDFVVPLVTFIFALPIILGITVIGYRKIRDYWSTRHYRRMDFLVDGMYND